MDDAIHRDLDMLSWPPRRSDALLIVGLLIVIYTAVEKAWGAMIIGVFLMIVGTLIPRMKGPFSVDAQNLEFKGELVPPGSAKAPPPDQQSAQREQPRLQAPPASSQQPED